MNSIRSYLVVMLVAAFSLVSFLAALNGYLSSMREAEALLDTQLAHANDILTLADADGPVAFVAGQRQEDFAFQVWQQGVLRLASEGAPDQPIGDFADGYRYANFSGYRWRTFTRTGDGGKVFIVAERADLRHLVAEKVVLESVLPLLLWLPVSALLVWALVGWGLRPLRDLSTQINLRRSDDLSPLQLERPPRELVQLIDSTNSLLSRLAAAFEREKHFASHAAHELRTPLSVLKVHLHNLAQELPPGHPALAHANAGVERMHHLVEQILDLSRTHPELIKANFAELDLHSLAQRITAEAWPRFAEKDQTLFLEGEAVTMHGDHTLLSTLLHNLLDNAAKYSPAGAEVRVSVNLSGGQPLLAVDDSGPGIPQEKQTRVFERFYRASSAGANGAVGSGLGLAIVEHIATVHGAKIDLAKSDLGGLSVRILFPVESA